MLTREGQRLIRTLLLGHSRDEVISCVVEGDLPALLDGKPVRCREDRVAQVVLSLRAGLDRMATTCQTESLLLR